jgi:hypothetical protein
MPVKPDSLAGRTAVAAVADPALALALVDAGSAVGLQLAIACPDAPSVVAINERDAPAVVGFAVPMADTGAWERLLAHVEQRLGPIDALVLAWGGPDGGGPDGGGPDGGGPAGAGLAAAVAAAGRDMATRGTGVVVTVGEELSEAPGGAAVAAAAAAELRGVRRAGVPLAGSVQDVAAAILAALAGG